MRRSLSEQSGGTTTNVAILGGGRLARAVALMLAAARIPTTIWSRSTRTRRALADELPEGIRIRSSIEAACEEAQVVLMALPVMALREVASQYGDVAQGDHVVVHAIRGALPGFVLPHRIIREETCVRKVAALGGPIYAPELASGRPIAAVLASRYDEAIDMVRELTADTPVLIHQSRDIIGVEVAGSVSNVATVAVGMADALSLGETARGVLLTRGLSEAARLGVRLGADMATFSGLAGVGDLIPRRVASYERHLSLGRRLARGESPDETDESQHGAIDGPTTARAALQKAEEFGIDLPLVEAVDAVVQGEVSATEALEDVLSLDFELGEDVYSEAG